MSVTGKACAIIPVLAMIILAAFTGCGPDRTGTAVPNQPPEVYIVNTPPDGAQFSRNPDLNWYATDLDGFIAFFRYGVVLDSMILLSGQPASVEEFIDQATEDQFNWIELEVDLDHPQSTATVRLYANVDFPVDSFVTQYFFIQAEDDQGAKSEILWRRYSRNNHYPNTHFKTDDVFINAKDEDDPAPGITLNWDGADSTDWGRAKPPLEYEWRLYGPFHKDASIYVNQVPEDCVWNPDSQAFINCINRDVLDIAALPEAIGGATQPILHSKGFNYTNDPTDVWVTDETVSLYNVFKDIPEITETTQFKFVFWVRARDDGFVPDPTPAFNQFYVLEALFERDVAVLDETNYSIRSSRWFPKTLDTTKAVMYDYVNNVLNEIRGDNYIPFDTFAISDPCLYGPDDKTDFFCVQRPLGCAGVKPVWPTMVDLLSHKVHLYINDDSEGGPQEDPAFGFLGQVYFGMDMGASGLLMCRNVSDGSIFDFEGPRALSADFASHFGIQAAYHEGWLPWSLGREVDTDPTTVPIWNEQFVAATPLPELVDDFPRIDIIPELINSRYDSLHHIRFFAFHPDFIKHEFLALPEVGTCTRTNDAAAVYLYNSIHGETSILNGQVCGVVKDMGDTRSAAYLFTPIATDPEQTHELLVKTIGWLLEPYDQTANLKGTIGTMGLGGIGGPTIQERREGIEAFLARIREAAIEDPEVLTRLGIDLKPFIVRQ